MFYFKSRVFSIIQEVAFYYDFKSKFGSEMAPFFARHCQQAIFFTSAFSPHHWRSGAKSGAKSGASSQHCIIVPDCTISVYGN